MDKKKIEEFATTARRQLIENLTYEASRIGITPTEIQEPTTEAEDMQTFTTGSATNTLYAKQIEQRNQLIEEIENNGFEQTIEKIAYTWFNRIIAIRFMEINNYLPTHTRVLSSITPGKKEPDIITEALNLGLDYTEEEIEQIYKYKTENQTDKLFKLLFIKQCNKLNEILPELFETIDDYTEILFNIQLSNENNIINKLLESIPEEDFMDQVEIIGWMYQYYNKELKDETYKNIKKQKVGKDRIPAVTQLFTPDWIVKYMVENSLGRLWIENHENNELKNNWKYYIDEAEQTEEVQKQLEEVKNTYKDIKPEEIKILDPSMGSGHILVYVFDVLMQIYITQGYTEKEATISILENNIYGMDIDDRAYQLAYFAIMMKARSYNRKILNQNIKLNLIAIQETNTITEELIEKINSKELNYLIETFKNAKTLGSIIKIDNTFNLNKICETINIIIQKSSIDISLISKKNELILLKQIIKQTEILNKQYDVVITNPPYMGNSNMNNILKEYLKKEYPTTKQDLYSVFMEKCIELTNKNGFNSMITMQSWMFLKTYEKLRKSITENLIVNLVHLGANAFEEIKGEIVQTATYVLRKLNNPEYITIYVRLINYNSIDKEKNFLNDDNLYIMKSKKFFKIPGSPFAYWISDKLINVFENKNLSSYAFPKSGLSSGNNDKFFRFWYEIDINDVGFNLSQEIAKKTNYKWFPLNKGGSFRKWWGNQEYVVDYENDGYEIKNYRTPTGKLKSRPQNTQYYFKESISWSRISSSKIGFRYSPEGFIFGGTCSSLFTKNINIYYLLGFLNSSICQEILDLISPTIDYNVGDIAILPVINKVDKKIEQNVIDNIKICKDDWDDYETSWNFKKHPFITFYDSTLENTFEKWASYKQYIFNQLKCNEINLNEIFSEIYHIETDNYIEDQYVSINLPDYKIDVKSFISYSIGCMFGRYSLDEDGLQFAGGDFNINNYHKFIPDNDNIIPILDTEYFEDDIVGCLVEFVKICFGEETLEKNLNFIADALMKKGKTNREIIRNYLLTDFFKDHIQNYKKCPIYWQFDSGKENAFKCLIYMHRYEPDLVSRIRFDYLHKTQRAIEDNIKLQESIINDSENKSRVNKANKKKTKLIKQLDEIKLYDLALAHVANQRIEIDLDDGVKVNYAKFQNIEVVDPNTNKTRKINLLKKI